MLRHITSTLTVIAIGGLISVSAQQQTPAPTPSPSAQEKFQPEVATLSGCVQEAKTLSGDKAYVLNKAEGGDSAMYVLVGSLPPSELATHVNHKVEVKGQVQQPNPPSSAAAASDPKVMRPPLVQVESVSKVADSCE